MRRLSKKVSGENHTIYDRAEGVSDRYFGLVFAAFFLLIAALSRRSGVSLRYCSAVFGCLLLMMSLLKPSLLSLPNRLWLQFGRVLHRIVSPVVLALFYFVLFTPYAVVIRLFRKDVLKLGREPERGSYWQQRTEPPESLQRQF